MIDQTTVDLRIAEHTTGVARVNGAAWRREGEPRRSIRATVAGALFALAARLDTVVSTARQRDAARMPTSPA